MNIAGSTALVTGGNRGLGRHFADELLTRGATVFAGARNPDTVDLPGAKVVQLDITNPASVAAAAEVARDITLLINNAGTSTESGLLGARPEDHGQWRRVHPLCPLVGQPSRLGGLLRGQVGRMVLDQFTARRAG